MSDRHGLRQAYQEALRRHGYRPDPAQEQAIARLDELRLRVARSDAARRGWVTRLRQRLGTSARTGTVRGVYLWGGVGRGKTFLMDLLHAHLAVPSRRDHFHRFMKDVHARLAALRAVEDPLARVAGEIAGDARVVCLDELFVSDIADAMILSGLFGGLLARGTTLVFTSNAPPDELYRDGLQRSRFVPAIRLIERHCEVVNVDAGHDYRLRQLEKAPLYLDAGDAGSEGALGDRFAEIAGETGQMGGAVRVEGRDIAVRRRHEEVVWFDFAALCEGPRGTADYVEIARDFHTVFVSGVPVFDASGDDAARRFIAVVDEFYDRGVKLVLSAHAPADRLYRGERLVFEFQRTRSRLAEMQAHEYLARPHRP